MLSFFSSKCIHLVDSFCINGQKGLLFFFLGQSRDNWFRKADGLWRFCSFLFFHYLFWLFWFFTLVYKSKIERFFTFQSVGKSRGLRSYQRKYVILFLLNFLNCWRLELFLSNIQRWKSILLFLDRRRRRRKVFQAGGWALILSKLIDFP